MVISLLVISQDQDRKRQHSGPKSLPGLAGTLERAGQPAEQPMLWGLSDMKWGSFLLALCPGDLTGLLYPDQMPPLTARTRAATTY